MSNRLHKPATPFDAAWLAATHVEEAAVAALCADVAERGAPTRAAEAAALLRVVTCLDLTTLSDDDTAARVEALCARARAPLPSAARGALAAPLDAVHVAAVCIYPEFISTARHALEGSDVRVCTVSAGFPTGAGTLAERVAAVAAAREAGAAEIDVVIRRRLALEGDWATLYDELRALREACADRAMKVILGTGELETLHTIGQASRVAMLAGADFIKTSTGKERVNATLPAGCVMAQAIRDHRERTGAEVGLKPAGGLATARQALDWLVLVEALLGSRWLRPERLRFGASSLLDAIVSRLEVLAT